MTRGVDLDLPHTMPGPLAAALVEASSELTEIARSRTANTGTFSYRFADLSDVLATVRPVLHEHGLAHMQLVDSEAVGGDVHVTIRTMLVHTSGATFTSPALSLVAQSRDAQKVGSAISYGRRYSLMSTLGIAADDDDDGRQAQTPTPAPKAPQSARTPEELKTRELLNAATPEVKRAIERAFRDYFKCGLRDLPRDRHAEALSFVTEQLAVPDGADVS